MYYYSFHIGDYQSKTAHLTNEQDLVYRRSIDMYYSTEAPIPQDLKVVARKLRCKTADLEVVLNDFFVKTEGGYVHNRCEQEIRKFRDKSLKAKDSAQQRWHNNRNPNAMRTHTTQDMRTHSDGNANQEPISNNHEPNGSSPSQVGGYVTANTSNWDAPLDDGEVF